MPPYYPDQYQNQYPNQYPYNANYNEQFNQYQHTTPSPSQPIPPFSQLQINIPPRQQQQVPPRQQQSQFNHNQNFQPNYVPQTSQYPYQYQPQPPYPPYQHHIQNQPQMQPQPYNQPVHQYQGPSQQIQVNIPKPQVQPQSQSQSQPPPAQPHTQPPTRVLKDVQPTAQRQQQAAPTKPQLAKPPSPELDPEVLLLMLADEYLEAAQKLPVRSETYFKLTSTALGCIDAVLNNFKLPPLREAQVALQYGQLLFNETENYDDAERILTKTIDQCERLKYHDLRYSAQLLLIRVLHQSRPKAALKDLQSMIQDIETYKHIAWEYAFRLQYVMFAMSSSQPHDAHVAISQLERICHVARQHSDHAILAFAAVLESLVHLQSTSAESVQSSQRSLAKARALQLNPDVEESPQICLMMEFVDLCGQIKEFKMEQSEQKRKAMQSVLYPALQKSTWRKDGLMYIPLSKPSLRGLQTQDGGLVTVSNGRCYLAFSWLSKDEAEDLGYLLSGVSAARKNAGDGGKAEKFFDEGIDMIKEMEEDLPFVNNTGDVMRARYRIVHYHFLLETVFLQCSRGQWAKAQSTMKSLSTVAQRLEVPLPVELRCLTEYIQGAIYQGRGELDAALRIFQSPMLSIFFLAEGQAGPRPSSQLHRRDEVIRNVSILAAINTIFIIQQPSHIQNQRLSSLLGIVDPLASQNANKSIQAAWNFVLATLPNNTILKTKQYLGNALNAAQGINNAQITTLCLVTMQEKFFKGVVGDQAVKCARAASHQAKRLNEPMWIATATGLESDCLTLHGLVEDSGKKREEMERAMKMLSEKVRAQSMGS